jgi:hypothetical protein
MARRTLLNSLKAYWSKPEAGVMYAYPLGSQTSSDGHLLHARLSCESYDFQGKAVPALLAELRERGYDIKTLRFSIMKDPTHPRWAPETVDSREV